LDSKLIFSKCDVQLLLWVSRYSLCCFFAARLMGTVCSWGLLSFYALLAYNLNTNKIL
jgi:hypothetical protein